MKAARSLSGGRGYTVRDLLAIDTPPAELLREDGSAHGFDNVSEGLRLSASQIEAYLVAADTALDAAINLKARPALKKERIAFLDSPRIKETLAVVHGSPKPDGTKTEQVFRAVPDAVVMFVNQANRATLFGPRTGEALRIRNWPAFATAVAGLLRKLKAAEEGGESLLRNTAVLFGSNLGNASNHSTANLPILLAGGGFKHGQHLVVAPEGNLKKSTPLSNLFVTMLQRMGVETDKFGSSTGTIMGLETA